MCRCLSHAVHFWIFWSAWLVELAITSWVITCISSLVLAFFWSRMTELLKEFIREFWAPYTPHAAQSSAGLLNQ